MKYFTHRNLIVAVIGLFAGFLSGLFGVGGGLVIVPALMSFLKMDQRTASATSLVSIVVTATTGAISYGIAGQVSIPAAALLILGALVGAQIGAKLLRILPEKLLPWTYIVFVGFVIATQLTNIPARDVPLHLTIANAVGLVAVGLVAGIFSGLVGVGGGGVIVPGSEFVVGMGDLMARGTSLVTMIPTALAGTRVNLKHGYANVAVGLIIGVCAAVTVNLGAWVAAQVSPRTGAILFSGFLLVITVQMLIRAIKLAHKS